VAGSGTSVFFSKLIWGTFHEMFSDCSNRTHFWDILRRQQNDIQQRHPKKLRKYAERAVSALVGNGFPCRKSTFEYFTLLDFPWKIQYFTHI